MKTNERLREIRSIVNMINGMKGGPVDSDRAFLLARLDELVKLAGQVYIIKGYSSLPMSEQDQKACDELRRILAELEKGE